MNLNNTMARPAAASKAHAVCGQCGAKAEIEQFHCFDAAWDRSAKERLTEGSFFKWNCPECGSYSELAYQSHYLDEENKLCVVLCPGLESCNENAQGILDGMNARLEGLKQPEFRHRAVGNFYAMQEQVRIREDGFDDRAVQLLKPMIIGQLQARGMEVWNGFYIYTKQEENGQAQQEVAYVFENGQDEASYAEPVIWFDIYLTNGSIIRQGINSYAYTLCGNLLKKARTGQDDGRFYLYDLSWAIGFSQEGTEHAQGGLT